MMKLHVKMHLMLSSKSFIRRLNFLYFKFVTEKMFFTSFFYTISVISTILQKTKKYYAKVLMGTSFPV